eukprot:TRINITY_DN76683_c0_g1_i1.p1 TRINITY_DN76683_c0_g1~~TRINITY_DN76683_c0_g1_i1.p1  ORF type:complete len:371 (-),score=35.15 TRINITY_DN76683_c0_g1_i1:213-1226(-)
MATGDTNDVRMDEIRNDMRRQYFREIGLEATEGRIVTLRRRADAIRCNSKRPSGRGHSPREHSYENGEKLTGGVNAGAAGGGTAAASTAAAMGARQASPCVSETNAAAHGHGVSAEDHLRGGAVAPGSGGSIQRSLAGRSRRAAIMDATSAACEQGASNCRQAFRDEMEAAKRELQARVRKFREDLVDEWREHEVTLSAKRRVVVGRDEREIASMPKHPLCINDGLKRSLGKMRENLFQRRLNLAVHEKTTNDWSLPQLRAEIHRRKRSGHSQYPRGSLSLGPSPRQTNVAGPKTSVLAVSPGITAGLGIRAESESPAAGGTGDDQRVGLSVPNGSM